MSAFTMADGSKVEVKPYLTINVSRKNPTLGEFYEWLETDGGGGDIIKRTVSVSLGKDSTEDAQRALDALRAAGLEPSEDVAGANATIKAHIKVLLEKGIPVPLELCQGHMGQVTKINRPEVKT